jgi:PKD repeat protein
MLFNVVARGNPVIDFPTVVNFCDTATLDFTPGSPFAPFISSPNSPISAFNWSVSPNNFTLVSGNLNDSGFVGQFSPGTYTIHLSTTNGCGTTTDSVTFTVAILTEGGFEIDTTAGCSPLTVNVTSTSAPTATHEWFVNGVLYSNALDTSMTFTNPSFITDSLIEVVLIVYSGPNCADTITEWVTVFASPNPNFSAAPVCIGNATFFFDSTTATTAPLVGRFWDFGDGNVSTAINPTHQYAAPGLYNVTLNVTNSNDCSFSIVKPVAVGAEPDVDFQISYAALPDSACVGDTIFFVNQTTTANFGFPIASYEWDLNNNGVVNSVATNFWTIYTAPGSYLVRLRAIDSLGCFSEIVRTVYISEPPVAGINLSHRVGCGPLQVTATNNTQGYATNFSWEFYTLNLNNTKNILHTAVQADPNPIPAFNAPGASTTAVYVKLVASNSCYADSITDTISVRPLPIPFFQLSQDTGCSPFMVTIQTDGFVTGQPDSIVFDYGDGTPLQTLNPTLNILPNGDTLYTWSQRTHLYSYNGNAVDTTYFITLRAVNECGDSTYTLPIIVKSRSVQSFFQTNNLIGCAPYTLNVTDGSFAATNVSYCFDYDTIANTCNGGVLNAPNGSFTFPNYGTYVVAQFANNNCGFDTSWVVVEVRPTPSPDFIVPATVCANAPFSIQNTSTINLGFITGYQWDFGDGTTSTANNPTHAFTAPGTYTVCLTALSATGCDSSFCKTVVVYNVPIADFEFVNDDLCLNEQPVSFINYSFDSLTNVSGYLWDFGDGNTSLAVNPFHSYTAAGTYDVKLIITNTSGCQDSIIKSVIIRPIPDADFSFRMLSGDSCGVPQEIEFTNHSNGAVGYFWDFNAVNAPGQLTSTLTHPTFTFTQPGTYQVRLIAQNGQGCTDTAFQEVRIHPVPEVDFSAVPFAGCAPLEVQLLNLTTLPPGFNDQLFYRWYFGDGGFSASQIPSYVFQQPGTYWVALAVETEFGCYDSLFIDNFITVHKLPEPSFTSEIVEFGLYDFTSTVTSGTPGYNYLWEFGDGSTSFQPNPRHRFNIQAVDMALGYNVCLTVTDINGCKQTFCDTLDVGLFTLFVPNAMAPNAFGEGAIFLPKGQGLDEYHLQIFDRWGNKIWETELIDSETASPVEGWDGKIEGEPVPIGVYVWRIDAKFANGKIWTGTNYNDQLGTNTGTITIVR